MRRMLETAAAQRKADVHYLVVEHCYVIRSTSLRVLVDTCGKSRHYASGVSHLDFPNHADVAIDVPRECEKALID